MKLVADLTTFVHPDPKRGRFAEIRRRLAIAGTLGKYETEWANAIRSIADQTQCPKYHGLKITPQLSLIPIGRSTDSGLWKFAHLWTTAHETEPIPKRDQHGRIAAAERERCHPHLSGSLPG